MKKLLVLTLTLTVALTVTTAASAHPSKQVLRLRHQLHKMIVSRNQARAALDAEVAVASSLQGNVSSLQAQIAQRTAERDAALTQVANLKAQLAAIPKPLDVAVAQVRREVAWGLKGSTLSYGRLVAQSAMDYANGHVSVGAYGYYATFGGVPYLSSPNDILGYQAGLCGKVSYAFAAIVHAFGLPVRRVQFTYSTPSGAPDAHTAAEVYYDGGWHYFDPTFGVVWTDANGNVLSISEARQGGAIEQKDTTSFTNLIEDPWWNGDTVAFEIDPTTVLTDPGEPFYL